jgi:hypothetical protein
VYCISPPDKGAEGGDCWWRIAWELTAAAVVVSKRPPSRTSWLSRSLWSIMDFLSGSLVLTGLFPESLDV